MSKVQPEDSASCKVVETLRDPLDAAQVKLRTNKSFKKMVCELGEKMCAVTDHLASISAV